MLPGGWNGGAALVIIRGIPCWESIDDEEKLFFAGCSLARAPIGGQIGNGRRYVSGGSSRNPAKFEVVLV